MADFHAPVSTTTVKRSTRIQPIPAPTEDHLPERSRAHNLNLESPDEILKALQAQPNLETVSQILKRLADSKHGSNLVTPSANSAQIVSTLVSSTIPDYWRMFKTSKNNDNELVSCLRSGNGLGAILSRLRALIAGHQQKKSNYRRDTSAHIEDLIDILERILAGKDTSAKIWKDICALAQNPTQKKLMWKEYVSQSTSGKIVSTVAEAEDVFKDVLRGRGGNWSWLGDSNKYASWLGLNLAVLAEHTVGMEDWEEASSAVTELFAKATSSGFQHDIVASIVERAVKNQSVGALKEVLIKLKKFEQQKYMTALLTYIPRGYFGSTISAKDKSSLQPSSMVSGTARLLHDLVSENDVLEEFLVTVLVRGKTLALDNTLQARRSIIAVLAKDDEKLHTLLEQSLQLFGDKFYIAHTPILHQEALAHNLLLTCGYVQRSQPMFMKMMAKSSYHVSGMSNRIAATSPRARFLGIAVGMAISKMVDKPEIQLKFDLEKEEATEAVWYQRLTEVKDEIGSLDTIRDLSTNTSGMRRGDARARPVTKAGSGKPLATPTQTDVVGPRIVEVVSDHEDEDEDLVAYGKPDSDPEDDTDDPTAINRNKPTAPVYIRDLIAGLRDQEDYDRHQLALSTAASLIRRKSTFGTEVTDHIEELASLLVGLQDNLELPDFDAQRQQALIAVLLAQPATMAQWFASTFFTGDFSISQRIAILTTLGLGARELAGLKDDATDPLIPSTPAFPSKTLPDHLHKLYAPSSDPVSSLASNLSQQLLSPMAASAADQLTGPNILKVRTFSSRMEVEKRRTKPIPNALSKIVADNYFFPLTGRWWINTRSSSDSVFASPLLLPAFLNTLALLLNAAGSNTLALPQMTREFWELLLSVRGRAVGDKGVLKALLFAFLMVVETNEDKERLATEQSRELLETQSWVKVVFDGLGAGSEEDDRVRVLAAGVLVRCQEVVEKYQRRMVGSMLDY
ncbi:hypothetical protein M011DRAFT_516990 [Sporormia fimetaria CBS 119925]|uniref:Telomere length regulation protein conserved domain-containing protein n=1 Tax=Sporormia fimetaria CBS 119925 TaxID=1340428 RepID=A0A6A6VKJ8_9PLEO|nr:hypothetical protein M011DRAFT_516990 [Sporormia fimetaria CBS 119925]